jgi:hypothetical protein
MDGRLAAMTAALPLLVRWLAVALGFVSLISPRQDMVMPINAVSGVSPPHARAHTRIHTLSSCGSPSIRTLERLTKSEVVGIS